MYFLVNASPLKQLDIKLQSLQVHRSHDIEGTDTEMFCVTLTPRPRSKVK